VKKFLKDLNANLFAEFRVYLYSHPAVLPFKGGNYEKSDHVSSWFIHKFSSFYLLPCTCFLSFLVALELVIMHS
jgi:hypothetical protein